MRREVWVTGASSGIGKETALLLAQNGHSPVLVARSSKKLAEVSAYIYEQSGYQPSFFACDITKEKDRSQLIKWIQDNNYSPDVLINNAGYGVFQEIEQIDMHTAEETFQVNVLGGIALVNNLLPFLKESNQGHIINVVSQAGKLPTPKSAVYAASKHAMLAYTNVLRMEVGNHVYVTAVNYGPVKTPFLQKADPSGGYEEAVGRWLISPSTAAEHIARAVDKPKREVNLPRWMNIAAFFYSLSPRFVETLSKPLFMKKINRR
ncbi:SDR family NAD(P)-dependent oxidoreductase [Salsuginibacillus kocurii]|uniref:SDR family NAD(P)-dependent oxidoreductase n=1 Tax=Salsuginibacillus kocurii TaxID=427078 RepID=UPI00037D89F9|nr:SDR family oxidoreductase [Salsuginibacillus kocurii]